ncbi:MAG: DUF3471 domain-containing protein [Flavisolibacter sp.]|nr:DUF3471 domain-containing protein [Flavisolibacter sp.]
MLLDSYTGRYKVKEGRVLTVSKIEDKRFAQPTGQGKLQLFPVSDAEFVLKEVNARITFVKGENGKADKLKLRMNGTDQELPGWSKGYCGLS